MDLKVNENETKIIKKIYDWFIRGYSYEEIAIILNNRSVISGISRRIDEIVDKMNCEIDYNAKYNEGVENFDWETILKNRNKEQIKKVILDVLIKNIEQFDLTSDIYKEDLEFLEKETTKLCNEPPEIVEDSTDLLLKNREEKRKFGYMRDIKMHNYRITPKSLL